MMAARKTTSKLSLVLREEMEADEKVFGSLSDEDSSKLLSGMKEAFKLTEQKDCGAVFVAVLADDTFLSEEDNQELYAVINAKSGTIVHSFGTTIFIKTEEGHNITFTVVGGANTIAAATQFMAVTTKAAMKKSAKKKPAPSKKKATVAPTPVRRNTRSSKKPVSAPLPATAVGKKKVVVLISSPTTEALKSSDEDSNDSPPPLSHRENKIWKDADSDSDSETSYVEYSDMGLTQEGNLRKEDIEEYLRQM